MEAVKQGSCAVGLKSDSAVVLATLKRSQNELSSYQRKVFKIDDHMGIAIAGLTADGRILSRYMRNECINHRYVYESALPVGRLVRQVADKAQVCTQRSWKRPYGVGLLVGGYDKSGAHLYHTCPSGNYYEYKAQGIGARAQASKTYLEKHFESFPTCSTDELIMHGLRALSSTITGDLELNAQNCAVAIVGKDLPFTVLEDDSIEPYIVSLKEDEPMAADAGGPAAEEEVVAVDEDLPAAPVEPAAQPPEDEGPAPMEMSES